MITLNAKSLVNRPFTRNVATVASGTVIAQAITLAFAPVITRLYGPETFGVLGVFVATTALVNTVGSLTYQIAVVLPKRDEDAKAVAALSVIIVLAVSVVLMVLLYAFNDQIILLLQIEAISSYIYLIPLFVFLSGLHKVAEQWIIRKQKFKKKAKAGVAKSLITNSVKTGFGLYSPIAVVLILVSTLGELLHVIMLLWGSIKKQIFHLKELGKEQWVKASSLKQAAKNHIDFPLYRAPQALVGSLAKNTPALILASFFGPAAAGFYAIGKRTIKTPIGVISGSVGKVFYPRISKAYNDGENIQHLLIKASLGLAAVGIIPFGIIILFGPPLFSFVFGSEWIVAGEYARWLSVWLYFDFVRTAATQTIPVVRMQRFFLLYTLVNTPIRVGVFIIAANLLANDVQSLALFCAVSGFMSAFLIIWVIYNSNSNRLMNYTKKK